MSSELKESFVTALQNTCWYLFTVIDAYLFVPNMIYRSVKDSQARKHTEPKKTVVIVGGNFAGLSALRKLQGNPELFNVILIDRNEFFEYTPGILRLFCVPSEWNKLIRKIDLPVGCKRIQGNVTSIEKSSVTYVVDGSTGQEHHVDYDYLILATGSAYNYPISPSSSESTIEARQNGWKSSAKKVEQASSILVIGGGAVGTELAAEIACHYKGTEKKKSVTLVDAAPRLVPLFPESVSQYALDWMKSHGVTVLLGQKLASWDTTGCKLQNGEVLKADLVFVCFGDKPNSGPLAALDSPNQDLLDRRKCVKVDRYLRVPGNNYNSNVFSCGDVAAPPTEGMKQAFHAEVQGHLAAENVIRLAEGEPLLRYPEDAAMGSQLMPMVYVLSLGKWDGAIGFNQLTVPGPLAAVLKWIIEWTKVRQMLGKPIGILIWLFGDKVAFLLSKTLIRPSGDALQKKKNS